MSPMPRSPRGMYFEEFEPGQSLVTAGRTITEGDIVAFAGLSGDFNQIHTDAEYSKSALTGQRIAHGLLVLSIAGGLVVQTGIMEGTIIVFREITEWKFIKPVFIGDTIHVAVEIKDTRPMSRLGGGLVEIGLEVQNQQGDRVMKGTWSALFQSQPVLQAA
jgi:3-hydroxybutyryl-CoA dehydratase